MGSVPMQLFKRAGRMFASGAFGRLAALARWTIPGCWELLFPPRQVERRLLIVYDLATQPFSIGDILSCQGASLVLREQYRLDKVDFALVYDSTKPACADPAFSYINGENVLYHVNSVLAAAQVNPHHGSLFIFDGHKEFQRFLVNSGAHYRVWPT